MGYFLEKATNFVSSVFFVKCSTTTVSIQNLTILQAFTSAVSEVLAYNQAETFKTVVRRSAFSNLRSKSLWNLSQSELCLEESFLPGSSEVYLNCC